MEKHLAKSNIQLQTKYEQQTKLAGQSNDEKKERKEDNNEISKSGQTLVGTWQ